MYKSLNFLNCTACNRPSLLPRPAAKRLVFPELCVHGALHGAEMKTHISKTPIFYTVYFEATRQQ